MKYNLEPIILGAIQGIAEWLPVSSEGLIVLVKMNFFGKTEIIKDIIEFSLFLHLGTFFAALVYFRKDVADALKTIFRYKTAAKEEKNLLHFLAVTTIISGVFGLLLLRSVYYFNDFFRLSGG